MVTSARLNACLFRHQVLAWARFRTIMEAHTASITGGTIKPTTDVRPHYVARRYAELIASVRCIKTAPLEPMLSTLLRSLQTEVERLLAESLARHQPSRKAQAAFLINNYELVVSTLAERGARGEESAHFEQLLDSVKAVYVEEELQADHAQLIVFVKNTEPLLMQGGPADGASRVDASAMEHLLRSFHDTWRSSIDRINADVLQSFANFKLGMDLLKQVLTQLLLYYTRFLDLVKQTYPSGAPYAQYILSIPTLMHEIKNHSRTF